MGDRGCREGRRRTGRDGQLARYTFDGAADLRGLHLIFRSGKVAFYWTFAAELSLTRVERHYAHAPMLLNYSSGPLARYNVRKMGNDRYEKGPFWHAGGFYYFAERDANLSGVACF